VGKTFFSRRLAYLLMGEKDPKRIEFIQFHLSYSYEDFVQGLRPNSSGGFDLKNGSFYDFCERARKDQNSTYVFVIDEINRGNLSKIFSGYGDMPPEGNGELKQLCVCVNSSSTDSVCTYFANYYLA
jgi:5-methylcytosine-specific restriction endonuclease McrBC GTP-binding regulatory subunit McrB